MARASVRRGVPSLVAATLLLAACASPTGTLSPTASPLLATPSSADPTGSTTPSLAAPGFAFAAEDVVAYYESQGYACTARQPSTTAVGFFFRTCDIVDDASRTRVVGVVTDPDGDLANGFASVQGNDSEAFLAPIDALEPLAGFLGAMLGENQGSGLLVWLADHLGDAYAETTIGAIRLATYTESEVDHSKLYVEVATQAYLDAPGVTSP